MDWRTIAVGPDGKLGEPVFDHPFNGRVLTIRVENGAVQCGSGGTVYYGKVYVRGVSLLVEQVKILGLHRVLVVYAEGHVSLANAPVARRFFAITYTDGFPHGANVRSIARAWLFQNVPDYEWRRAALESLSEAVVE